MTRKDSVFSAKKSWRKFTREGVRARKIRRVCIAALTLEAAVLFYQHGGTDFFALRAESESSQWMSPAGDGGGYGGLMEEIFGFRLRLRDGAVEFYRQEENVGETNPGAGAGESHSPSGCSDEHIIHYETK